MYHSHLVVDDLFNEGVLFNLEYPGLLPSYLLHGVSEQIAVIEVKRCDSTHPRLPVDKTERFATAA